MILAVTEPFRPFSVFRERQLEPTTGDNKAGDARMAHMAERGLPRGRTGSF